MPVIHAEPPKTQIMTFAQTRKLDSKFNMVCLGHTCFVVDILVCSNKLCLTINYLVSHELVICQVTVRIVEETKLWYFEACSSCSKEIEVVNGKYRCEECKRNIPFPEKRLILFQMLFKFHQCLRLFTDTLSKFICYGNLILLCFK